MMAARTQIWGALAALTLLALVAGCDRTSPGPLPSEDADGQAKWWSLVKENKSPRQGVDFTWEVHDAPGPFAEVIARAQYDVVNESECGFVHPMTGTATRMTTSREVALTRSATGEYSGTTFLDLLHDGDYYGRGPCRWKFTTLSVAFRATGSDGETVFTSYMDIAPLTAGESITHYYPDSDYPRVETYANYPSLGATDLGRFRPEVRAHTFSSLMRSSGGMYED